MNFKIHRGTKEIGGSCVEIWTDSTRIVIDIGMPLVDKQGGEFDFEQYKSLGIDELVQNGILPDIQDFYRNADKLINGLIISHAHIDHYGFSSFVHPDLHFYLGEATHMVIKLTSLFTPQQNIVKNFTYFEKEKPFVIGDITVTPYWMDHSAFDAYAFLIESNGKSLFYSGDFRAHGRKHKAFEWFLHNAPLNVDYLLMEGTLIDRTAVNNKSEDDIEDELVKVFSEKGKINLVYTSGQNIDRLVSIYKACKKTGKLFVVDVYTATVLKELSPFAAIPFPALNFKEVKVIFPFFLCKRLTDANNQQMLYQFRDFKITKEQIAAQKNDIVLLVRPPMKFDLEHIPGIDGGNFIYSLWEGYFKSECTVKFADYLLSRKFTIHKIHTSGHADIETLKKLTEAIKPKTIIPIHTFSGNQYQQHFNYLVLEVNDGVTIAI